MEGGRGEDEKHEAAQEGRREEGDMTVIISKIISYYSFFIIIYHRYGCRLNQSETSSLHLQRVNNNLQKLPSAF